MEEKNVITTTCCWVRRKAFGVLLQMLGGLRLSIHFAFSLLSALLSLSCSLSLLHVCARMQTFHFLFKELFWGFS